ncbi:MAG: PTS transporter subunit EIIC [Chloroflexota bacterium]|jgi:PTS system maltose and glucose-specific IIC component|nr:PTS transporter subunit EIIC [Chloroflexota bacterium]
MKSMRAKIQSFAGAMMVPVILFVLVGFYVGVGAGLTNYILPEILPADSVVVKFITAVINMFVHMGFLFMNFLPVWFAVGIAFTLAKKEKGWAAFAGLIMFFTYIRGIGSYAGAWGVSADSILTMEPNFQALWGEVAGIFTLNMGIFSGIVAGVMAAWVHNRYIDTQFKASFAFFSGPRFVIIMVTLFAVPLAIATYYIWPFIGRGLQWITNFIGASGLFGTWLFGFLDKALLPFGIHHLIAFPIEYSAVGGTMNIDGTVYEGVRNIIMGQAASPNATGYITRNFTTGRILFQLAGLPGAAYAMWKTAKPENRKKVASIVIPAVLTLMLVGISEPIEYTFLFVAPALYWLVYAPLSGLMYVLAEVTNVSINGHALFFMIPNLFQPAKVHAMSLLYLLPLAFILYYLAFRFMIQKFDLRTPGRGEEDEEVAFMTKKQYDELSDGKPGSVSAATAKPVSMDDSLEVRIIEALGGAENIESVSACATRLRVEVKDTNLVVEDAMWKQHLEALGVVRSQNALQIIYGVRVTSLLTKIKDILGLD